MFFSHIDAFDSLGKCRVALCCGLFARLLGGGAREETGAAFRVFDL
jgi:hypothetical protein